MWEDEVLKWQMLFGNEWVKEKILLDAGVTNNRIPVGFYEVRRKFHPTLGIYKLKTQEQREAIQARWDKQKELTKKLNERYEYHEQKRKSY